ncbi:ABC transporter permease [Streptomyces sp. DSM 44917]|uniref:ABC transporter permease n=1 Tax=Streptomyces boetiae TaxID=3075541 RepID=A0ABU2L9D5_9ACTN|nr:ABC transporter permease [Streptomyces sp. DSM 44917]MDT0308112.1 ABC transporter permease [Streptomyces sp. DSM 44917]
MIFTYLRRELRRRRRAQFVIAAGLALGIALVVVVNAVSSGMQRAQEEVLRSLYGLGTDITVTPAFVPPEDGEFQRGPRFEFDAGDGEQSSDQLVAASPGTLDAADVERIAGVEGVSGAVGGLSLRSITIDGSFQRGEIQEVPGEQAVPGGPGIEGGGGQGGGPRMRVEGGGAEFGVDDFAVYGTDVTQPDLGPLAGAEITDGRALSAEDAEAEVALVDADHAAEEELAVGDTVTLRGTDFEVVGVTATEGEATAQVYLPLARAQELSGHEDEVTNVYVQAEDSQRLDAIETAIGGLVDDVEITTADDLAEEVSGSLSTAADLADGVGTWLSWLVLAVSFLVAGLMASAAVSRRVTEFGTLKALGWTRRRVTGQVMGESLVTGLAGGALGLGLGLLGAWTITALRPGLTAELASGGGPGAAGPGGPRPVIMGGGPEAAAETLDIGLTAPVSLSVLALAVGLAVLGGLIAGAFAASRAARLRPADALRRVA